MSFTDQAAALLRTGSMNSLANQSSSSGWLGLAPALPKSLAVGTMPRPKTCCQMRLTITRASSGLFRLVAHLAKRARRWASGVFESSFNSPANSSGAAGTTSARKFSGLPRCITRVTTGSTNRPTKLGRGACSSNSTMRVWMAFNGAARGARSLLIFSMKCVSASVRHLPFIPSPSIFMWLKDKPGMRSR